MAGFLTRPFQEPDRSALISLWERCSLLVPYNNPDQDIDFCQASPAAEIVIGELDNNLIASVMVGHDGHRGWLYYVAVDPNYQRQGFGGQIVAVAEAWLASKGVKKAMLLIRETNEAVKTFYEDSGYEAIPRIVMQKWIG